MKEETKVFKKSKIKIKKWILDLKNKEKKKKEKRKEKRKKKRKNLQNRILSSQDLVDLDVFFLCIFNDILRKFDSVLFIKFDA